MQTIFLITLFILGACLGSFLCCQARRLRLKEQKAKPLGARSVCQHCHYQLKWYDNIPIISWLILKGECRKCHHKIGLAEILSELGLALAFLALGFTVDISTATSLDWASFIIIILLSSSLAFLAIYDGAYGELPTFGLGISLIFAIGLLILKEYVFLSTNAFTPECIWHPLLSLLIIGGLYLILYVASHGKWVGDGDWILGSSIAIALFDPWLALVTLFLANLLASLVMYPMSKGKKQTKVHFGPFMVTAFIIVYALSDFILQLI